MAIMMGSGLKQSMVGPPQMGGSVPKMGEGLGLPNGQAAFNLSGMGQNTPPVNVDLSPGANTVGNGGFKFNITRTAGSDPVQNILNDMVNPLGGTKINGGPQASAQPPMSVGQQVGAGGGQPPFNPFAPIGTTWSNNSPSPFNPFAPIGTAWSNQSPSPTNPFAPIGTTWRNNGW